MALKYIKFVILICVTTIANAQIPAGYYDSAENLNDYELKTALYNIISSGHSNRGYTALWSFYINNETDTYYENDGTILDIYSENPNGTDPYNFTPGSEQCGNYSIEGDCYNREHSFPKSWFNDANPMYADVHHIFPTDGKVNGYRGSYPYGTVGTASTTSENGSKVGSAASGLGYSGTVFEPINEFKGDVARAHFYMATRYENIVSGWYSNSTTANAVLDGSHDKVFEDWALDLLYSWHKNDPVSQKEIDRNNAAYSYQGNRNPFVDHPEYIDSIWFPGGSIDPVDPTPEVDTCDTYYFPTNLANPVWYEVELSDSDTVDYTSHKFQVYRLINDTTIEQEKYSKLYLFNKPSDHISLALYIGAVRNDTCGRILFIPENKEETILYNFNKVKGDTIYSDFLQEDFGISQYYVISTDSVEFPNLGYKKTMLVRTANDTAYWIEGIGSTKGFLWPVLPANWFESTTHPLSSNDSGRMLVCNYISGKNNYSAWDDECFYETRVSGIKSSYYNNNELHIYPQPANSILNIEVKTKTEYLVKIINTLGREVVRLKVAGTGTVKHDISGWPAGVYVVLMEDESGNKVSSKTLLIQ